MKPKDINFPISNLGKLACYRLRNEPSFSFDEYGLLAFPDFEDYVTNYEKHANGYYAF